MSIRCEELNLPAVIGVGEENYEKIKNCIKVNLNCKMSKYLDFKYEYLYIIKF